MPQGKQRSGPVPKRAAERAGHRAKADQPDRVRMTGTVTIPRADGKWHPRAKAWYRSLRESGQSTFFEPSDWAQAVVVADLLSRELRKDQPSQSILRTVFSQMGELGTSEGARRRMGIEVDRDRGGDTEDDDGKAAVMQEYGKLRAVDGA